MNSSSGEVDDGMVFHYHQEGDIFWGEHAGGDVVKESIVGFILDGGVLNFRYQHLSQKKLVRIGCCISKPVPVSQAGPLELHEEWQWLNGDLCSGSSVFVECSRC